MRIVKYDIPLKMKPGIEPGVRQEKTVMSELDAVLFANEAFYRAFADRDMDVMDEAWAEDAAVSCIHPGWGLLESRDIVLQSWLAILTNPSSPAIQCVSAQAHIHGEMAYVTCFEVIEGSYLIATNIFIHEGRRWRLVHHQAGPTAEDPPADADEDGGDGSGGLIN